MSDNPYQSPLDSAEAIPASRRSRLRSALCVLNFVVSACLATFMVYITITMPTGILLPGMLFQDFLFAFYALFELYAVFRKDGSLERRLGWANLAFVILLVSLFSDEIYETFLFQRLVDSVIAVKVVVILYVAFSALVRLRWIDSTVSEGRIKEG